LRSGLMHDLFPTAGFEKNSLALTMVLDFSRAVDVRAANKEMSDKDTDHCTDISLALFLTQTTMFLISMPRSISRILPSLLYAARKASSPRTAVPAVRRMQRALGLVQYSAIMH
jgi:hypothetical protein